MKYSIITINYNNADGLCRTLESVIGQTYSDYEYVIIDGGSTDGSIDIIHQYIKHIDYWVSERDGGIYNAMNKGVKASHGDYCIFMNSGDCFHDPQVLENIQPVCNKDIVVGKVYTTDGHEYLYQPSSLSMYFFYSCSIAHQGAFIRRTLLEKFPYDETLKITSDWKFFVQAVIFDNCSIEFHSTPVALFESGGISMTQTDATWNEKLKVMKIMFPDRVLEDYRQIKQCECLTLSLLPSLRKSYRIDKLIYKLAKILLKLTHTKICFSKDKQQKEHP